MLSHYKAHGDDLENHFQGVDNQENEINNFHVIRDEIDLFIGGKHQTIEHNDEQDEAIEAWVDRYDLNDLVPERVRHGQAAEGYGRVVLLRVVLDGTLVIIRVCGQCLAKSLHIFDSKLAKRESRNLQIIRKGTSHLHSTFLASAVSCAVDQTLFS